jgi:hypothetical protein
VVPKLGGTQKKPGLSVCGPVYGLYTSFVFLLTRNTKEVSEMEVREEVIINLTSDLTRIEASQSEFKREVRTISDAAERRQAELEGAMAAIGFSVHQESSVSAITSEIEKSAQIEGERIPHEDIRSSVARHT